MLDCSDCSIEGEVRWNGLKADVVGSEIDDAEFGI